MRTRSAQLTLTVVCLIFGALLMMQFRTQGKIAKSLLTDSAADQTAIISNLYEANVELRAEADKLAAQELEYERSQAQGDLTDMAADLRRLRVYTGQSEISGPGVELGVTAGIKPEYVQDLINELRNAGAEAIAVNGERVIASSPVTVYKNQIVVNETIVETPLVFLVVGNPETLDRALARKGGMISFLRQTYSDGAVTLDKRASLTLPMYRGSPKLQYAQVVKPGS